MKRKYVINLPHYLTLRYGDEQKKVIEEVKKRLKINDSEALRHIIQSYQHLN